MSRVATPNVLIVSTALGLLASLGAGIEILRADESAKTRPDGDAVSDTELRARLRPPGEFRDLVQRLAARLMRDPPEENQCEVAYDLGRVFWWMTTLERQSIDDDMLNVLVRMLSRDSADRDRKCIVRISASVLGRIGPRARSALPALKAQLAALEADAEYQRAKKARALANPILAEGSIDFVLRGAIANIERVHPF